MYGSLTFWHAIVNVSLFVVKIHVLAYFNLWNIFFVSTIIPATHVCGNLSGFLNNETSQGWFFDSYCIGWKSGQIVNSSVSVQWSSCVSVNVVYCLRFLVMPTYWYSGFMIMPCFQSIVPFFLVIIWCGKTWIFLKQLKKSLKKIMLRIWILKSYIFLEVYWFVCLVVCVLTVNYAWLN